MDAERDCHLRLIDADHLFEGNLTRLGLRRGRSGRALSGPGARWPRGNAMGGARICRAKMAKPCKGLCRIPLPMRRLLAIFLLILLPLQAAWVAAAPYCGHEPSAAVEHVGHHQHAHESHDAAPSAAEAGADQGLFTGLVDLDCHSCHGFGNAMVLEPGVLGAAPGQPRYPQGIALQSLQPPLSRPERPRWQPLA